MNTANVKQLMVQAVTMPILVVIFGAVLVWFASAAGKRGWLK